MIHGLVDKPLMFTLDDLKRLPRANRIYFLECAANSGMEWRGAQLNGCQFTHGMIHNVEYTGVPLKILLEEAGPQAEGEVAAAGRGGRRGDERARCRWRRRSTDCLIAYRMNGEMLRPEKRLSGARGGAGLEANMWVKWIRRIEAGDEPWHHREETSKYTDLLENGKAQLVHLW